MIVDPSVSWQPLASMKCSTVCWVNTSPPAVAAVIPKNPLAGSCSASAAAWIASNVFGAARPGSVEEISAIDEELAPPVAGHGGRRAVDGGEFECSGLEGIGAEALDDLSRCGCVE